jgi:hypothetical protein
MTGNIINPIEATRRRDDAAMPFQKGIRVACPMKNFVVRQTVFCLACDKFKGVMEVGHVGKTEGESAEVASKLNRIICKYPMTRRLHYFPED